MAAAIVALAPIVLSLISWLLSQMNVSNDVHTAYMAFLQSIQDDAGSSEKLRSSALDQRARIQALLDQEKK